MTFEEVMNMSKEVRDERYDKLSKVLDTVPVSSEEWDKAYEEYSLIGTVMDHIYRKENEGKCEKFFKENIKGHTNEENNLGYDFEHFCNTTYHKLSNEVEESVWVTFAKEHKVTVDYLRMCVKLQEDVSFYSDYHKDVYGYRPRYQLA